MSYKLIAFCLFSKVLLATSVSSEKVEPFVKKNDPLAQVSLVQGEPNLANTYALSLASLRKKAHIDSSLNILLNPFYSLPRVASDGFAEPLKRLGSVVQNADKKKMAALMLKIKEEFYAKSKAENKLKAISKFHPLGRYFQRRKVLSSEAAFSFTHEQITEQIKGERDLLFRVLASNQNSGYKTLIELFFSDVLFLDQLNLLNSLISELILNDKSSELFEDCHGRHTFLLKRIKKTNQKLSKKLSLLKNSKSHKNKSVTKCIDILREEIYHLCFILEAVELRSIWTEEDLKIVTSLLLDKEMSSHKNLFLGYLHEILKSDSKLAEEFVKNQDALSFLYKQVFSSSFALRGSQKALACYDVLASTSETKEKAKERYISGNFNLENLASVNSKMQMKLVTKLLMDEESSPVE